MRNLIILAVLGALLTAGGYAESQIGGKAGQFYLGLNVNSGEQYYSDGISFGAPPFGISFGTTSDNDGDSFAMLNVSMLGECGFFVVDGLQIGAVLFYQMSLGMDGGEPFVLLGPGISLAYLIDLGGTLSPYVQLNGQFIFYPNKTEYKGYKVMPTVGVKFFVNTTVALDLGAFFNYSMLFDSSGSTGPVINMYGGIRLGVGFFLA